MSITSAIRYLIPKQVLEARDLFRRTRPVLPRECPICSYHGFFKNFGQPPRIDAQCWSCGSLERHRLFWLWYSKNIDQIKTPILHFAPEDVIAQRFTATYLEGYKTADLFAVADLKINIEVMDLPDAAVSTVICNHVLEHVDDIKALGEINRVLAADGRFIVSVPIVEGWDQTYENVDVKTAFDRDLHFGQYDHVRYYGRDFRNRLTAAGFNFQEITAEGEPVVRYGLLRGEKFFICHKISAA